MRIIFSVIALFFSTILSAQEYTYTVFKSETAGHKIYRIPAIISTPDGTLLAFAEGCVHGGSDFGDINILLKRSTDHGKTWSKLATIVDYDSLQAGNPAPVVDLTDPAFPKGRIFLFYNTGNNQEGEIRKGKGIREVWYKTSNDGGITWSDGKNITARVHRPSQPSYNPTYNFPDEWRSYANTPGHDMQLANGKYKGRILVAANHSKGEPLKYFEDYFSHVYYTDDHGKTFKLSQSIQLPGSNEATAAEISSDGLILNARNQKGDVKARIVAISENGGETFDSIYIDRQLPDPVCEGSILNICKKNGKYMLAFCNAADTSNRDNLTLRINFDEGRTWPSSYLVDKSPKGKKANDYTAYSDIVRLNKHKIGVLYERNNYSEIVFKTIK